VLGAFKAAQQGRQRRGEGVRRGRPCDGRGDVGARPRQAGGAPASRSPTAVETGGWRTCVQLVPKQGRRGHERVGSSATVTGGDISLIQNSNSNDSNKF
jgi:hypothetical protein